jgi:hypothetical protein
VDPNLKYAGEGIFLLGVAFRLLRWALGAVVEGDAPPSAYAALPTTQGQTHPQGPAERIASTLMATPPSDGPSAWYRAGMTDAPPLPGDPALFPPEMLAAMTPEQRAHVLESLAKQRGGQR